MRLRRSMIGKPFLIFFWDHVETDDEVDKTRHVVKVEACGKLMSYNRREVVIRPWDMPESPEVRGNVDYVILRKAVLPDGLIRLERQTDGEKGKGAHQG